MVDIVIISLHRTPMLMGCIGYYARLPLLAAHSLDPNVE